MGGGLSRHELAAAVSEAGGLGTIAVNGAAAIRRELAAARSLTGRPLAVNLLLPFARRDWFAAAADADAVVTFWGRPTTPHARRLDAPVWLGGGGPRGARGGGRRGHRAGRRGGWARARSDARAGAAGAGARRAAGGLPAAARRRHRRARRRAAGARRRRDRGGAPEPVSSSRRRAGRTRSTGDVCWRPRRRSSPSCSAPAGRLPTGSIANAATERRLAGDLRGPWPNRLLNRLAAPGARYVPERPATCRPSATPGQPAALAGGAHRRRSRDAGRCRGALRGGDGGAHRRGEARRGSGAGDHALRPSSAAEQLVEAEGGAAAE